MHVKLKDAARHDDHCSAYCGNHLCDHSAVIEFAPLLEKYGEDYGMDGILARMVCKQCGHRGATMRLASRNPNKPAKPLFDPVTGKRLVE